MREKILNEESKPICLEFSTLKSFDDFPNVSSLNALLHLLEREDSERSSRKGRGFDSKLPPDSPRIIESVRNRSELTGGRILVNRSQLPALQQVCLRARSLKRSVRKDSRLFGDVTNPALVPVLINDAAQKGKVNG